MSDKILVHEFVPKTIAKVVNNISLRNIHQSRKNSSKALIVGTYAFATFLLAILDFMTIGWLRRRTLEILHELLGEGSMDPLMSCSSRVSGLALSTIGK